ncbi:MAG: Cephalosporinase [Ramlibacter sp.]|jgi:glyoxylase-like metal-dependent hydrolase (beta-lactamase superfamily II)|nr:Cephalosporinase [Ramlibacter sp.]MCE3271125.1 Cephalosporinase [Ramlibacter sp.]
MVTWRKGFVAVCATLLLSHSVGAQQPPRKVVAQQVSASAWFVQGDAALGTPANRNFISNAGFVVTPAGVVVIDALGSPQLARELLDEIARVTPRPVTHVVVTHYHADHIYGLQEFRKRGARIIAQRGALDYIHSDTAASRLRASRVELAPWIDDRTELVVPDQWIDGATDLEVGGVRLRLQPVGPAHTPEDLAVVLPAEGVLFAGDLVFRGRIPFVGQADSRQWIAALDTLLKLEAKVVVPGHGALSTTAREDMQLTRDYLAFLREKMGAAAREMEPFDEAYARVDWSRYEHLPLFRAANRMNAYNTYLLMERQVR